MRSWTWLMRLAAAVWLAWLGLVGLLYGMLRLGAWHPHFLPVTVVLVVLLAAGPSLLIVGGWQLVRGPRRMHALACLLLGLPPLGFLTGHLMYGFGTAYGRQFDLNLPIKVLMPFGESILDLVARFQYPQRTEGERVVMISTPLENARVQVAAMDRHIRALEARLGRTGNRRVHWVRGPLLGMQGKAILGMCMGSLPGGGEQPNEEGLTTLDRHEVAHVVLSQFCTADSEPPAVLMEGWAEVASIADPNSYRLRAWVEREAALTLSLEELSGPRWYGGHDYPVYLQGAPLLDYILRQFGPERFVELYATCHRATFAGDCRRILGVTIVLLDEAYWADLEKRIGPGGYHGYWLASLQLGPGVDRAEWARFTADYLAAAGRMLAPYEHVRLTAERVHSTEAAKGQTSSFASALRIEAVRPICALRFSNPNAEEVYLAHPVHSFCAERTSPGEAWEVHEDPGEKPELTYRRIDRQISLQEPVCFDTVPLFSLADVATTLVNPLTLKVTRLERFAENGQRFIRLELEDCPPGQPMYRKIMLRISADDSSVAHDESVTKAGNTWRGDAVYESHGGVPLLQSTRSEGQWDDGSPRRTS